MKRSYILTIQCKDRPGLVAAVTTKLFEHGANITEAQQFVDPCAGRFFIRVALSVDKKGNEDDSLYYSLKETATYLEAKWTLRPLEVPKKVLILVSKQDHCLVDLLYRKRVGELYMDVVSVVSNHPLDSVTSRAAIGDIPFHYFPVIKEEKIHQESQIKEIIEETSAELVILARYMQILSDDFAAYLSGRCINIHHIHHSFLPGFKGAKPYDQAHRRGVKIIGATAHYVTGDLDAGPIIAQDA